MQILYNQMKNLEGNIHFWYSGVAPTLAGSTSCHYERYDVGNSFRRLTNVEYARIQGFPDNHCNAVSLYKQYKLYGNAVPPKMMEFIMKRVINYELVRIDF